MKYKLSVIIVVLFCSIVGLGQQSCPKNPDDLYDRKNMVETFENILIKDVPNFYQVGSWEKGYFIYDLTDPTNKVSRASGCINFIDHHVYHFSPISVKNSFSHIAFLQGGRVKVFNLLNCSEGDSLQETIDYAEQTLNADQNKMDTINRLKNYRRYGDYASYDDVPFAFCKHEKIPDNSDMLYDRAKILDRFSEVLHDFSPKLIEKYYSYFRAERSNAIGFFIYDLTDPTNKQTSLLERVEFKDGHVYHFAFIDEPFSFSHIAILEDGKMKIFKGVNCPNKGDNIQDVLAYLSRKLKDHKNKRAILKRVKNYREYGVYVPYPGFSKLQCD